MVFFINLISFAIFLQMYKYLLSYFMNENLFFFVFTNFHLQFST